MSVTVIKKTSPEKDIFFAGNLVESTNNGSVYLVTGEGDQDENFSGVRLVSGTTLARQYDYSENYCKEYVTQFYGELLISAGAQ